MTTEAQTRKFFRRNLDLPVTWQSLKEVHIPLSYAARKCIEQVGLQVLVLIAMTVPLGLAISLSFRPFMHSLKPFLDDPVIRGTIYIAIVVAVLWLISRTVLKDSLQRLKFLFHLIFPLYVSVAMVFAGG